MSLQERQKQCERDNAINALREQQRQESCKPKIDCTPINAAGKYSKCCTISPIAPTAVVPDCPCEPSRPPPRRFCTKSRNECDRVELTAYGKNFACKTGKIAQTCLCVKFNGLQDSCRHTDCYPKIGCMDNPFPNCPPAREWKNEYQRKNNNYDC